MPDDTFRPRKVSAADVDSGAESLQEGAALRRAAAAEVGGEFSEPGVDSGIKVTGNVPDAFKQALAARRGDQGKPQKAQTSMDGPISRPQEVRLSGGSGKLEELIAGAQTSTHHYHEVTLPSQGRFYVDNGEGPADGKLHVRPMTGEEEQILATPRLVRRGQAINMIFDRCIREDYKSENFLTPDRTFLLIFLRGLSYTKDYDVEVRCPECNTKFATIIDLDALWVDKCPLDFDERNLEGKLPTTGFTYRYRISKGTDEQHIQDYRERRLKGFDLAGQADDTLLYRTAMLLEDIEGLSDKTELQLLLKRLPINDVAYLRNTVNNQPFGVDTNVNISCPSCFADFSVDLPLEANFFFPRARRETPSTTHA